MPGPGRPFIPKTAEEWMQVHGGRTLVRLVWLGLLGLGAGVSCDSPTRPSPVVTVIPNGLVTLNVGDTLSVRAEVRNATQPTVRFTTSNAGVATVDEGTGLVRGVSVGEATITATAVADPGASASVQIRVNDPPAAIAIQQILNSSGALIDPRRVAGNINVQLAAELGGVARLEVLVDTVVACQQSFASLSSPAPSGASASAARSGSASPTTITCPVNTATFDPVTGIPAFRNGPVVVRARLLRADGRVRSETSGVPLTLANSDTLVYELTATKQATDAAGLRWFDGNLQLKILPVLYNPRVSLASAEFLFQVPDGRIFRRRDTTPPFVGLFEEDSLANVTHERMIIFVHTATTEGQPGPAATTPIAGFRYDNQPPLPGSVVPREWMGAQALFADRYLPVANGDRGGVGGISARFYAADDPILSDSAVVARGRLVGAGADLRPGAFGSYKTAALVCDALDNCVLTPGFRFGVDLAPPTIEKIDLADGTINPTADFGLRLEDDLSGFDPRPLEVTVVSLDANPATPSCGPGVDGIDLPGKLVGASCLPDSIAPKVPVPTSAAGYYTYTLTPLDRAGNRGTTFTRRILIDRKAPEFTSFVVPGVFLPGDEGTFTAAATDNVDLVDLSFRLVFPAAATATGVALPFAMDTVPVGIAFDAELTTQGSRTSRFPVVRALTTVSTAGRSTVLVDSVQVQATDAAGLSTTLSRPITLGGSIATLDPFVAATIVDPTQVAPGRVCTLRCQSGGERSLSIKLRIAGTSALTQPFARVYYYRRDLATGVVHLLGSGLDPVGVVEGGQASFTYSFNYVAPAGLEGSYSIFAVGVNSAGYALRNQGSTVEFFQR